MGEVYRARDTRLDRAVALKIVRDGFAGTPDRLARFEREAKLLAALNHPNIAHIYGLATAADDAQCIVMELVEGETLQARVKRGALPPDESLAVARQIAAALEAAHERGIIHRDLKPGNVMVDEEGRVKVLDFGLGKALDSAGSAEELSHSPTMAPAAVTGVNVLLGTVAYMSPEQVRGKVADERSDIWAFGCVLYEMLTGKQAFAGETASDIMGDILRVDPDWKALPAKTPPALQAILKRCLQKDRRQRYHASGDLRHDLEAPVSLSPTGATSRSRIPERVAWAAAALGVALAATGFVRNTYFTPVTSAPVLARFMIDLPPEAQLGPNPVEPMPSLSPDGRYLTFRMLTGGGQQLWLRPMGSVVSQLIAGTNGVVPYPFWSADSRFIGFFAGGQLKKVAVDGGPPQALTAGTGPGGTWNQSDTILFDSQGSIHRVSAAGGASSVIRSPDKTRQDVAYAWPAFLPDGQHFLYVAYNAEPGRAEVRVGALDRSDDRSDDRSLFPTNSRVLYAEPGYLLFNRDGTLMAQPFEASTLSLTGQAFPVAESVGVNPAGVGVPGGAVAFGVSRTGALVYRLAAQAAGTELTWFDRTGKNLGTAPVTGVFIRPIVFPDQNRILLERVDGSAADFWTFDIRRGASSRFTFDPAPDQFGAISPDGTQVAFASSREGRFGIYVKPATGVGAEQLVHTVGDITLLGVADWSPDGRMLLYNGTNAETGYDTYALPMSGERKPIPLLNQKKFSEYRARFSPDGRWFLYTSDETGRSEIYVQPFPQTGGKWQVSVNGGNFGYWRRDGREIIFDSPDGKVMAVDVKLGDTFEAGIPQPLLDIPGAIVGLRLAMTADAQRFLIPLPVRSSDAAALRIVLNWPAEIAR